MGVSLSRPRVSRGHSENIAADERTPGAGSTGVRPPTYVGGPGDFAALIRPLLVSRALGSDDLVHSRLPPHHGDVAATHPAILSPHSSHYPTDWRARLVRARIGDCYPVCPNFIGEPV